MLAKLAVVPAEDVEPLDALTTTELRARLANLIGLTARNLLEGARVWAELERRGEDLSGLRSGLLVYLPLIACGSVLPETVVAFSGRWTVLKAVAGLPVELQRKLVAGEPVAVAEKAGDRYTHRMLPAHALTPTQVRLVFGDRCIRSEVEQTAILSSPPAPYTPGKPIKRGKITVDKARAEMSIGRSTAPLVEVVAALKAAGVTI